MTYTLTSSTPISRKIAKATQLIRTMIDAYVAWGSKIAYNNYNTMYGDVLDFVNFRIETTESCLLLVENGKVADALGLSRSLFEHYLLLMLMCRGTKFFKLEDLSGSTTEGQFKVRLAEKQAELEELRAKGETHCLYVAKYPRLRRQLMYVFEGLISQDIPGFVIPIHFFHFQEFRPEQAMLKDEDYFQYHQPSEKLKKKVKGFQQEAETTYRHYLSYDALLQCLEINDLIDAGGRARAEAHYTFLGKFLHPTSRAARDLHEHNNYHGARPVVGMRQPYTEAAVLLALIYLCYIVAGTLDEIAGLFERAPAEYMTKAGTSELRDLTARVPSEFPYFWFMFNDPPLYDRFNYCVSHATDDELAEWGGYPNLPLDRISFSQYVYSHFQRALNGYSNTRCGVYESPLA